MSDSCLLCTALFVPALVRSLLRCPVLVSVLLSFILTPSRLLSSLAPQSFLLFCPRLLLNIYSPLHAFFILFCGVLPCSFLSSHTSSLLPSSPLLSLWCFSSNLHCSAPPQPLSALQTCSFTINLAVSLIRSVASTAEILRPSLP